MTKQDIITQVSKKADLDQLTSLAIIDCFFEVVKDALIERKPIYMSDHGGPAQR